MARYSSGSLWAVILIHFLLLFSSVGAHPRSGHNHQHHHHHARFSLKDIQAAQLKHESPFTEKCQLPPQASPRGFMGDDTLMPRELLIRADTGGQISSSASNDFTCGPNKPCGNGACCGESGWCGYAPKYCGTGCQSNCDAKAECGQYAKVSGQTCPLNVCCSEHGFCGTTTEFCKEGCQSFCAQPKPSTGKTNVQQKVVGYWEGWNENKACEHMEPDEIPVNDLSHLIFAFAFITPDDYKITNMADVRPELFKDITFLKNKNPDLTVMIALGGWTHNDPGRFQKVFSNMVATSAARKKFIDNLLGFLSEYGFDGVDFDWEYPGADDRGGTDVDGVNYTQFLKELRAAINASGKQYVVTYTAPTSYWYLRHFDLKAMNQYVDWINLMSYDLHGTWDSSNPIGNQVLGHTNLTEIDLALDLFWRNDIAPKDIVLGMGFYGRSFKVKDSNCWKPGCAFSGGGDKGKCTNTAGFLSYSEIMDIISSTNAKPVYDKEANVNYLVYGQDNWISYDDKKSFERKIEFANDRGLGGLMIWAIDLDDSKHSALSAVTGNEINVNNDPLKATSKAKTVAHSTDDPSKCRVTECGSMCNQSETAVGRVRSKDGANCKNKEEARWICCPAWTNISEKSCYWDRGTGAVKEDCAGKCKVGDIKIIGDSWGWKGDLMTGDYDFRCGRGGKIFCCGAGNLKRYLEVCSWTKCGEACPSDKQNVLTVDSGGDIANERCDGFVNNGIWASPGSEGTKDDPKKGTSYHRKLCCPQKDSFKNCEWKGAKTCSEQCGDSQITLDLDPQGPGSNYCHNGRQQAFCCDAPGRANQPFLPVDLDKLFPPEYMPPADAQPQFEIMSFGGSSEIGDARPNESGIAFFLIAGSSTGLSSMSKRDNPGLHFVECPENVLRQPVDKVQTARVICLDDDVEKCFSVRENGVEGTIVHMPLECGNGTYARAVSLTPSKDQTIQASLGTRNPTSAVYDFSFDYNLNLARRDAGSYSIRMDYSNVKGYWDAVVNSDGVKRKRDLNHVVERFFSSGKSNWFLKFNPLKTEKSTALSAISKSKINHLVFFDAEMCSTDQGRSGQGIIATIQGELDAHFYYGFSMIATWAPQGKVNVHQAAGFLHADGKTSATYTVAGIGTLDTSKKLNGDAMSKTGGKTSLGGHSLFHGWASFVPYREDGVRLKSSSDQENAVSFNGRLVTKAVAEWGGNNKVFFPTGAGTELRAEPLVLSKDNSLKPLPTDKSTSGEISLGLTTRLGLQVSLDFKKPYETAVNGKMPDMSIMQSVSATWQLNTGEIVCVKTSVSQQHKKTLTNAKYVGWGENLDAEYESQKKEIGLSDCFKDDGSGGANSRRDVSGHDVATSGVNEEDGEEDEDEKKKDKRQNDSAPNYYQNGDYRGIIDMPTLNDMINKDAAGSVGSTPELNCVNDGCGSCTVSTGKPNICCGCAWIPPDVEWDWAWMRPPGTSPFRRSSPLTAEHYANMAVCLPVEEELHRLMGRNNAGNINTYRKNVNFWDTRANYFDPDLDPIDRGNAIFIESEPYPGYPNFWTDPHSTKDFDASTSYNGVKRYFHNATATCTSFDVAQFGTYDMVYLWPKTNGHFSFVKGQQYHQVYNTEHVFEGQTISRFFDRWLPSRDDGDPSKRFHFWVETFILTSYGGAPLNGASWAERLVDELGSQDHQDRLTIFLARSNQAKGRLFRGTVSITPATFGELERGAEQLLAARELGMVFTYMNHKEVWNSFCSSYNAMLDVLVEFDTWYEARTFTPSVLREEWPKFIRHELDRVVKRARDDLKMMNQARKTAGAPYTVYWGLIMNILNGEIQKVKLDKTDPCRNLPASTVGRYTG